MISGTQRQGSFFFGDGIFGARNIVGLGRLKMDRRVSADGCFSVDENGGGFSPAARWRHPSISFLFVFARLSSVKGGKPKVMLKSVVGTSTSAKLLGGLASFGDSSGEMRCPGGPLLENTTLLGSWMMGQRKPVRRAESVGICGGVVGRAWVVAC